MLGKVYCILYHQPKQLCFTEFKMSDFFLFLKEWISAFLILLTFIPGFRINFYIEITNEGRGKDTNGFLKLIQVTRYSTFLYLYRDSSSNRDPND